MLRSRGRYWARKLQDLKARPFEKKPNVVTRDQDKIPAVLINLHKEVFLTCHTFFVNNISFFLTLSRNIYFTVVNHLTNHTVPEIFKILKDLYQYSLHHGFRITTLHVDGEFGLLNSLL